MIFYINLSVKILWSLWKSWTTNLWDATDTTPATIVTRAKDTLNKMSCMQRTLAPVGNEDFEHLGLSHHYAWSSVILMPFLSTVILSWGTICVFETLDQFLLGKSDYSRFYVTIMKAGTLSSLEALKVAISNGMHFVLFETDSKILSDMLATNNSPINEFADFVS